MVLGASGFIGKHLVERLAAGDWAMPVAASHRTRPSWKASVETIQFDARNRAALLGALHGAAGVVNCITGDAHTIIASARSLFEIGAEISPAPRIVNLSTMMVYGSTTGAVDETTALNGDWDGYSAAKVEVEQMARAYESVVHLRPGIVYGPRSPIWSGGIARWLLQRRLGNLGAAGDGYCNLVHVGDVVDAIERALRIRGIEGEAFNLSSASPPTWNEYFRQYAAALGTCFVPISRTRLLLEQYLVAPPLKIAEILSQRMRAGWRPPAPIRPWLLRLCAHPIRMNVGKAESRLGMQWIPLDQGLRDSAAWYLSHDKVAPK